MNGFSFLTGIILGVVIILFGLVQDKNKCEAYHDKKCVLEYSPYVRVLK